MDSKAQEIRLLTLLPWEVSDDIHVTLKKVTLNPTSPPLYEALSYTWGCAQDTVSIWIKTAEGIEGALSEFNRVAHKEIWIIKRTRTTGNSAVLKSHGISQWRWNI